MGRGETQAAVVGRRGSGRDYAGTAQLAELLAEVDSRTAIISVRHVISRPDNTYRVVYEDGREAIVDLDGLRVAFSDGDGDEEQTLAALYMAAAYRALIRDEQDPRLQHLADAYDYWNDHKNDLEAIQILAQAAEDAFAGREGELQLNPDDLCARFEAKAERKMLPREAARAHLNALRERVQRAVEYGGPKAAGPAMLFSVNEDGSVRDIVGDEAREESRRAAIALGGEHLIPKPKIEMAYLQDENGEPKRAANGALITKSVGEFEVTSEIEGFLVEIGNRWAFGQRSFACEGEPGAGKTQLGYEVAASLGMPVIEFNVGPGFDWEQAFGGDGLVMEEVHDEDGTLKGAAPVSGTLKGAILRALEHRAMVMINEVEGMEREFVRFHPIAGDRIAEPEHRYATLNSSTSAASEKVHPDAILWTTWNGGHEDSMLGSAFHSRSLTLRFGQIDEDEESRRLANNVTSIIKYQDLFTELKDVEVTAEQVKPVVKFMRRLRDLNAENPDVCPRIPSPREAAHFAADLISEGARANTSGLDTALISMRHLLPNSLNMPMDEVDRTLREVASDEESDMADLCRWAEETVLGSSAEAKQDA